MGVGKGGGGVITTPLLQCVARLHGGGEIVAFGWGGYQESRPRCSLFVGSPSLFFVPSGERLVLPNVLEEDKPVRQFPCFGSHIFLRQRIVVYKGVTFRPRAVVAWRGAVAGYTRISSQKYEFEK